MISKQEVEHIAKLARLELTESEVEKMQKDLSSILDYFDVLKKAPKVKVVKKAIKAPSTQSRVDVVIEKPAGLAEKLVTGAPDKKDGYIKVKSIL
ncbi:MAG: Asp-tRNA(Asn)/Glu-tRNA(Gln) amidotransferase subunit GatC [Candidatus Staskawiczbacteria bacterium]|nr:Asp-tRNA(Asn)/Glu-tRNA(Gln) amidotransferase subunit GatC [Candidatus Staskawiczbacteria bacterium]